MAARREIGKYSDNRESDHNIPWDSDRLRYYRRSSILVGQRSVDLIEESGEQELTVVVFIIKIYKKWGFIITKYAWLAILLCLIFSALATLKILYTPQTNELTGYVPFEARARTEFDLYNSFFSYSGRPITSYIFLIAKDGESMLRDEYMNETLRIMNLASYNITLYNKVLKREQQFAEFCINFCIANEPVRQYYNGLQMQLDSVKRSGQLNSAINLSYPISSMFGRKFSLQPNFFGIEIYPETEMSIQKDKIIEEGGFMNESFANDSITISSDNIMVTNIKSIRMIALQFRAEHLPAWSDEDVKEWEMRLVRFFQEKNRSNLLNIYVFSQTYIETEMIRAGLIILPYLTVGFIIMCTCSIVTVMLRATYMHQHNIYKIILAIMACVTPLLGCSTALAILFIFGLRFSSILCVVPFLVLSIGVDSSYLMIHEWQKITDEISKGIKRSNSAGQRISEVLSEVGPAILISAITNILADTVGCWTSSPEIRILCIGNLFSMFMAYIYQMTFFSGLMSIIGRFEIKAERENSIAEINVKDAKVEIHRNVSLSRKNSLFHDTSKLYISKYMKFYVNFMTQPIVASLTIMVYILYIAVSIWGITRLNITLRTQKLFALDSPLVELDKLRIKYQVPTYTIATVFVNKPGNLSDPSRLILMNEMVDDFESIQGSWGPVGTMYFIRDFEIFLKNLADGTFDYIDDLESEVTTASTISEDDILKNAKYRDDQLETFLSWPEYVTWNGFVRLNNGTAGPNQQKLKAFFFVTAYQGDWLIDWVKKGELLNHWRSVVDRPIYHSFEASVFHEDGVFLDLIENMPTDAWQSILGTLICMAGVCFVFLRSTLTVSIAACCVLSICLGILGTMSLIGIDLDPISMAAMIISIGFSVDIPAHVSYHYYKACETGPNATPQARLGNCLSSVAFPAVQAALSTMFCVISLLFVKVYMAEVFVEIMITCVILCNIHGLLFLPAILSLIDTIILKFRARKGISKRPAKRKKVRHGNEKHQINPIEIDVTKVDRPTVPND